jgi:hypothetical protein
MPAETRVFQTRPRSSPVCTRRVSKTGVHQHASAAILLEPQLFRSSRPTVLRRDTTAVRFVCHAYRPSLPVHLSPQPVLIAGAAPRPHRSIQPPHLAESPQKPFDHCCRQAIRYAIAHRLRTPGSQATRLMSQPFQRPRRAAFGWSFSPYAYSMHSTAPHRRLPSLVPGNADGICCAALKSVLPHVRCKGQAACRTSQISTRALSSSNGRTADQFSTTEA